MKTTLPDGTVKTVQFQQPGVTTVIAVRAAKDGQWLLTGGFLDHQIDAASDEAARLRRSTRYSDVRVLEVTE